MAHFNARVSIDKSANFQHRREISSILVAVDSGDFVVSTALDADDQPSPLLARTQAHGEISQDKEQLRVREMARERLRASKKTSIAEPGLGSVIEATSATTKDPEKPYTIDEETDDPERFRAREGPVDPYSPLPPEGGLASEDRMGDLGDDGASVISAGAPDVPRRGRNTFVDVSMRKSIMLTTRLSAQHKNKPDKATRALEMDVQVLAGHFNQRVETFTIANSEPLPTRRNRK